MKKYELAYIASVDASQEEIDAAHQEVENHIQKNEGVVTHVEKTVARPLAYPIQKARSGYFNFLEFQIAENKIKELGEMMKKNKTILRHLLSIKKISKKTEKPRRHFIPRAELKTESESKKAEPVNAADIDKKIDELLQ